MPTGCIYSVFYIKPQLGSYAGKGIGRCIYSVFYIKPQQRLLSSSVRAVVSIQYSTSNHN